MRPILWYESRPLSSYLGPRALSLRTELNSWRALVVAVNVINMSRGGEDSAVCHKHTHIPTAGSPGSHLPLSAVMVLISSLIAPLRPAVIPPLVNLDSVPRLNRDHSIRLYSRHEPGADQLSRKLISYILDIYWTYTSLADLTHLNCIDK